MKILTEEYQSYCKEQLGLSDHTLRAYDQDLRAFDGFARLTRIGPYPDKSDIISFQIYLREEWDPSPATVRRRMVTLKSYFRWFEEIADRRGCRYPIGSAPSRPREYRHNRTLHEGSDNSVVGALERADALSQVDRYCQLSVRAPAVNFDTLRRKATKPGAAE